MNAKKLLIISSLLLSLTGTSKPVWPSLSLPKISFNEAIPLLVVSGTLGIIAHKYINSQTTQNITAPHVMSYNDEPTPGLITPSDQIIQKEPIFYNGFTLSPFEHDKSFKESKKTKKIGALKFNALFKDNILVPGDRQVNIFQVKTEKQTLNTCLYHSLKNALLLKSQILGEPFPKAGWEILNKMTNIQNNEWKEVSALDNFLSKYSQYLPFDITALSNDRMMLRAHEMSLNTDNKDGYSACSKKITCNIKESNQEEPYIHALIFLTANAAVTKAEDYAHWYCLLIHRDSDGNRNYIIADSLNAKRTNRQSVRDLILEIESQFS